MAGPEMHVNSAHSNAEEHIKTYVEELVVCWNTEVSANALHRIME